jgi:hypothetical protein
MRLAAGVDENEFARARGLVCRGRVIGRYYEFAPSNPARSLITAMHNDGDDPAVEWSEVQVARRREKRAVAVAMPTDPLYPQ